MDSKEDTMKMHNTFFWGKDVEILFSGWPGHRLGMYILAIFIVFVLSFAIELLSCSRFIKPGSSPVLAGIVHALRVGLAYMLMLAVMSFNLGVLIVAIAGHALGFSLFNRSQSD